MKVDSDLLYQCIWDNITSVLHFHTVYKLTNFQFAVLLIITTIVHAFETLGWIVEVIDVFIHDRLTTTGVSIVIFCIIVVCVYVSDDLASSNDDVNEKFNLQIYTVVSAFKLSKAYRRPPVKPLPLTAN